MAATATPMLYGLVPFAVSGTFMPRIATTSSETHIPAAPTMRMKRRPTLSTRSVQVRVKTMENVLERAFIRKIVLSFGNTCL